LSPVYAVCDTGKIQSPIDVPEWVATKEGGLRIDYGTTMLNISHNEHVEEIINNGHTIQINVDGDHGIELDGRRYTLKQFHFHTPSEHTVDGKRYPMEMHCVHTDSTGAFAVLGVLFEARDSTPSAFDKMLPYLPAKKGDQKSFHDVKIDLEKGLPAKRSAFQYVGSFTTPPCTQNVQWVVMTTPIVVAQRVIDEFSRRLGDNHRPTQPLNGRTPTLDVTK
jgi:carbonic anhydrase